MFGHNNIVWHPNQYLYTGRILNGYGVKGLLELEGVKSSHNQRTVGSSSLKTIQNSRTTNPSYLQKKLKDQWFSWKTQQFYGLLFDFFRSWLYIRTSSFEFLESLSYES
jgi:hypothetical protein